MLSSTLVDSVSLFLIFYHYFFSCLAQLKIEEITRMLRTGELGIPDNPDERYICYGANKDNSLNKLLHVAINYLILMTSVFDLGVLLVTT